uniref:Uncharacterized protein n=2 Tax=Caenorhabditis japonica TaxID=281687 RepID=A0A8R1IQV8_CAEJA
MAHLELAFTPQFTKETATPYPLKQPDSKEQSNQQRRYPERGSHPLWFMALNRKDFGHTTLLEDYTYTPHFEAAKD